MPNKLESKHAERKVESTRTEKETKARCSHYWIIEPAHGPTSKGVCKYCGEEREFLNSWPESLWEGDLSTLLNLPSVPDIGSEEDKES